MTHSTHPAPHDDVPTSKANSTPPTKAPTTPKNAQHLRRATPSDLGNCNKDPASALLTEFLSATQTKPPLLYTTLTNNQLAVHTPARPNLTPNERPLAVPRNPLDLDPDLFLDLDRSSLSPFSILCNMPALLAPVPPLKAKASTTCGAVISQGEDGVSTGLVWFGVGMSMDTHIFAESVAVAAR